MSDLTSTNSATAPMAGNSTLCLVGIILAFLGLAGAVFGPLAFEVNRPPPKQVSDVLADTAVKIKERFASKEPPPAVPRETDRRVVAIIVASALGFIGAALGAASWIRRENLRISGVAVAVGVSAIAFHYILAAVGIAIVLIIIGWLFSIFS